MRVRSLTHGQLVTELAERIDTVDGTWVRVAVDGATGLGTTQLADDLVEELRPRGRDTVRVRTTGYLRPASLRLEHGHEDPESYYRDWFDYAGLRREVLAPLAEDGTGHVLPALWDATRDRSPRLSRRLLAARGVALVDGPLLLGAGLPFDFVVHLGVSPAALPRRVPEDERWTLPALHRYVDEVAPEHLADCAVRVDRPERPAVVDSTE